MRAVVGTGLLYPDRMPDATVCQLVLQAHINKLVQWCTDIIKLRGTHFYTFEVEHYMQVEFRNANMCMQLFARVNVTYCILTVTCLPYQYFCTAKAHTDCHGN